MPETRESGTPPNFGPFDLAAHYVKFSEKPNEFRKKSTIFDIYDDDELPVFEPLVDSLGPVVRLWRCAAAQIPNL